MSILIKRLLFAIGLILTGLITSPIDLHPNLLPLQTYHTEIFYTNCLVLFSPNFAIPLPTVPQQCATIEWLLPAGLMASGVIVLLFGFTKTACFFSILNLTIYVALFLNLTVDSSFGVYAHLLEVLVCMVIFMQLWMRQGEGKSSAY